jgi:hypothetical protein
MARGLKKLLVTRSHLGVAVPILVACLLSSCVHQGTSTPTPTTAAATRSPGLPSGSTTTPGRRAPVFAIYYLWWDRQHWTSRLGRSYPSTGTGQVLPATLDASGCATRTDYPGNVETDVSPGLSYDQDNPATITRDVRLAAQTGLAGFVVNWVGTGAPNQNPSATSLNTRLGEVFAAVHQINSEGTPFKIILNYQSSARRLATSQFINDFGYFVSTYGKDPALDHSFSPLPEVVMAGTWKYSDKDLATISRALRGRMYLIGDEKPSSWDKARAEYLDGTSYYWSSQNPIANSSSFATLRRFAASVRATLNPDGRHKTWLAPFTPGYNAMLLYHTPTCVPRDGGKTMRALFTGNAASQPDGWTLISWNEITEGTYVVPLLRYGTKYLELLTSILRAGR